MRKSNWLIAAVLIAASIVFLCIWNFMGFSMSDASDLAFTIVWWVVIVAVCIAIQVAENRRRQSVRTAFLAPNLIYNSEAGIVKVQSESDMVPELQKILNGLQYNMQKADVPNRKRIHFEYVVRTNKFAQDGNVWEGEVVKVSKGAHPKPFRDRGELQMLLEGRVLPA